MSENGMSDQTLPAQAVGVDRQTMDVDIVCVGFGPAMGGFLTTLARGLTKPDGTPAVESRVMPGMPPQVLCYERADDIGFGVSGVVTIWTSRRSRWPPPSRTKPSRICWTPSAPAAARRSSAWRTVASGPSAHSCPTNTMH
jgi:hypothetical protein